MTDEQNAQNNSAFEQDQQDTIETMQNRYNEVIAQKDAEIAKLQADIMAKNNTIKNILNQQPTAEGEDAEYQAILQKLKFIK